MLLLPTLEMDLAPYQPLISQEIEALEGDSTAALYRYWLAKKPGDAPPDWADFHFLDLYRIAPVMFVMDVDDPNDVNKLRYRHMGTRIVEYRSLRLNPDLTGKTFGEGDRSYDSRAMAEAYWTACIKAVPVVMRGDYRTENAFGRHERLLLPWMIDGKVARLTGCLDRFPPDPK
ncbi:MAG: hypothetical protein CMM61_00905 [Rhodospirillaceae bacterium]|nr:hypothetical protein [Rhodospirillaceae bacterium]